MEGINDFNVRFCKSGDVLKLIVTAPNDDFVVYEMYCRDNLLNCVQRWEPKRVSYNMQSYHIEDYTKIMRLGTDELEDDEEILNGIKQLIENITHNYYQFKFIGMLGLNEPKRM